MGCGSTKVQQDEQPMKKNQQNKINQQEINISYKTKQSKVSVQETNNKHDEIPNKRIETSATEENNQQIEIGPSNQKKRKDKKLINNKIRGGEDTHEAFECFEKVARDIGQKDILLITKCLKSHFVFYALTSTELEYIIKKMFYCKVGVDQYVFNQGDNASTYYIIEKGKVNIQINGVSKHDMVVGQSFGELALLYNATRSASVKCIGECGFWAIDRQTFRKTVKDMVEKNVSTNRKFIEQISFFNFLTEDQKDSISHSVIQLKFQPNSVIVHEGDQANSYYMIKDGTVSIWKENKELRKLGQNDSFGENALYEDSKRAATVKADTECEVLSLGRDNLTQILGQQVQVIIHNNLQRWAFDKSDILNKLTKLQTEKIFLQTTINQESNQTVVFQKSQQCNKLVIVLEGKLIYRNSQKVVAERGFAYGDQFLLEKNQWKTFDDDIIMDGKGYLSTISFEALQKCIGGQFEKVIENNENSHEKKMARDIEKIDYTSIVLEELIFIKKLGQGQFGTVYLTLNKKTGDLYALKSVSKAQIVEFSLENHINMEKQVLELVQFPFIMKFYRTFKDEQCIFFLTEFINGMELFDVIRDIGLLSTYDTQFYVGSILLALEFMHSKQIIYRDLKPENIMVDKKGIMYIIDLGTGKTLNNKKGGATRTYTIIGTPHYMAPEIIQGKGYGFMADLWSVGICFYEFMCGAVPYAEDCDDPYEIYQEILKTQLTFPSFMKDKKGKKLVEQLLSKIPDLRLGGSYASLKAHPWFDNFDWDKLYNKQLPPPYVPPHEKICSEQQILSIGNKNQLVINEIKKEQGNNKKKYKKDQLNNPDWDKDFQKILFFIFFQVCN